ncbi:hypothetical protein OAK38_04860 [Verrucomicrobia bacterium]|nr:hypothetical protein [Verrucomicrobiota bacterium]
MKELLGLGQNPERVIFKLIFAGGVLGPASLHSLGNFIGLSHAAALGSTVNRSRT